MRREFTSLHVRVARVWHRPIPNDPAALKQPGRFAVTLVACWLIAIAFPLVDLFGAEAGTRNFSREIFNLVMGTVSPQSVLFPKANPLPTEDPASRVTVVLVDEATLDIYKLKNERTWPASARFYHQALLSIWRYKPRAVFADVMFIDELPGSRSIDELPGSFAPFSEIARLYKGDSEEEDKDQENKDKGKRKPVPLLIMEPTYAPDRRPKQDFRTSNLPDQFAELHKDYHPPPVKAPTPEVAKLIEEKTVEPVAALASVDVGVLRSYDLYGLNAYDEPRKAAAVRLYELETGQPLDLRGPRLEIFWDLRLPESNARWLDCTRPGWFDLERLDPFEPFTRAAQAIWNPDRLKQTCGTVQTVPLADLLLPDTDPDSKRMIEDNIVLFGTDIVGGDVYTVPVSDRLPGVYVHAMALENLLAFGSNYIRTELKFGETTIDERRIVWIFEATLIALVVWWFARARRNKKQQDDASMWDKLLKALVRDAKLGLTTSAAGFLLSTILLPALSLAPLNWIGVGALAALTNEIRNWTNIDDRVLAALRTPSETAGLLAAPEAIGNQTADKEPI
jgi:CHASE2 domain-containing sensor protein